MFNAGRPSLRSKRSLVYPEFIVAADIHVPNDVADPGFKRKQLQVLPAIVRRKDKADDGKLVKRRSLLRSLSDGASSNGQWRSATCKLMEEGERCLLNIYIDESILYQTLYIHLLHQTDIRIADYSMFFSSDCLAIYAAAGQRWTNSSGAPAEPVFLKLRTLDSCRTWLALLRSYAVPEIYGRLFQATDGGLYRMWRQIQVSISQVRNLGTCEMHAVDPVDFDISCDMRLGDALCGRTKTVKKGIGSCDWHESFTFTDLHPFDVLDLTIWSERRVFRRVPIGSARIILTSIPRWEDVDGWYPLYHMTATGRTLQAGEIRLKIRLDEEIVLPYSSYSKIIEIFNSRNFLDWMVDFDLKLNLKTISGHLLALAIGNNVLVEHIEDFASRDIGRDHHTHDLLFRNNTTLSKTLEMSLNWFGTAFLEVSIGPVLRKLCSEKVSIEVDPLRRKGVKELDRNYKLLIEWCQAFWTSIYAARSECPIEIRRLLEVIRRQAEQHYRSLDKTAKSRNKPRQCVSAFFFPGFLVVGILQPQIFGLCSDPPSPLVQRSLTLIARAIQHLSDLEVIVEKQDFTRGIASFLSENRPAMIDYILVVSTPSQEGYATSSTVDDMHDRIYVAKSIRERGKSQPALVREAIPILPHLLDIPRQMAMVVSAVIRHSTKFVESEVPKEDHALLEFCSQCMDLEENALFRVSQLAALVFPPDDDTSPQIPESPTSSASTLSDSSGY